MAAKPKGAAEEGVPDHAWRRVHPVTPLLNGWRAIAVLILIVAAQNLNMLAELMSAAGTGAWGRLLLIIGAAFVVLVAIVSTYSYLAWKAMTYAVTDQAVWLRQGVLLRRQRHVRLERIQAVDVTHPLLGRIFGLGRLTVDAAGGAGSSLVVGYLSTAELTDLRANILARAAGVLSDGEDAGSGPEVRTDGGATLHAPTAAETLIYAVDVRRLVTSLALSIAFVLGTIALLASIVVFVFLGLRFGWSTALAILPTWGPIVLVVGSLLWARFAREFNFHAAVSPDGIRVRRGLLEQRAETIPPRRVHAVRVSQPLLWRHRDWYRVTIAQAASHSADSSGAAVSNRALLPVGTRQEAMMALWLVLPDLGVDNPTELFVDAVRGTRRGAPFVGVSRRAWIFDPLVFNRRGMALTDTCVVVRDGWLTRTADFAPYERVQSVLEEQGPLSRALDMSGLRACLVPGPVTAGIANLTVSDASALREELVRRSHSSRVAEPPERWFQRVNLQPDEPADESSQIDAALEIPELPNVTTRQTTDFRPPEQEETPS